MQNFWDYDVWGTLLLFAVLFAGLLAGNMLKKGIPVLRGSLIPASVLGGAILVVVNQVYKSVTGGILYNTALFGGDGAAWLEIITYHCLALGFISSALKPAASVINKKRTEEIFNTGVTTVSTYLLQGIIGIGITLLISLAVKDFFAASGLLLPFGYGQGTGQALNYGNIYEIEYGFEGGKSFGLTVAAFGFLSAAFGGVIHLNIMKKLGRITVSSDKDKLNVDKIEHDNEIPMQESIDKLTIQIALVFVAYTITYVFMYVLGNLIPGMKSTIYGFNFLLGVLSATLLKGIIRALKKIGAVKKDYTNAFLLTRTSNFFFDLMVIAGIAAIRLEVFGRYWWVLLLLGIAGVVVTYVYNRIVVKSLFKDYPEEQFLAMFGMLTGTASTGIILLREIDGNFETPAADNLVYQNFPAIVFGFPMMILASLGPKRPVLTLLILTVFFVVMNVILFRKKVFGHIRFTNAK